jgi:hypothetical protein
MKTVLLCVCLLIPALAQAETITNVNLGTGPNAGNGDAARVAFDRLNRNNNLLQSQVSAAIAAAQPVSFQRAGLLSSNDFARTSLLPTARRGGEPVPMRYISSYGVGATTPTLVSNVVLEAQRNGLAAAGWNCIDIVGQATDGYSGPFQRTRDGNGNLQWGTNWTGAMVTMKPWMHSIAWKIRGYAEFGDGPLGLMSWPVSWGHETNDALFFSDWADYMQVDYDHTASIAENLFHRRMFVCLFDQYHTNGPTGFRFLIDDGFFDGASPKLPFDPALSELCTAYCPGTDISFGTQYQLWRNALTNIDRCYALNKWTRPDFVGDINNILWSFGFFDLTNDFHACRGLATVAFMLSVETPSDVWNFSGLNYIGDHLDRGPGISNVLCNQTLKAMHYTVVPCQKFWSNNAAEAYIKQDGAYKYYVVLFNRGTNGSASIPCNFSNAGIPAGTWTVSDLQEHTNWLVTGGFTNTVFPMDALAFSIDTTPAGQGAISDADIPLHLGLNPIFADCVFAAPLSRNLQSIAPDRLMGTFGPVTELTWVPGVVNRALYDGNLNGFSVGWSNVVVPLDVISTAFWFKTTNSADGLLPFQRGLATDASRTFTWHLYDYIGTHIIDFYVDSASGANGGIGEARLRSPAVTNWNDDQWHFAASVYDGTNTMVWLDVTNFAQNETTTSGALTNTATASVYSPSLYEGALQWPMIFHRIVTSNEFRNLYFNFQFQQ